ncbi:MAG: GtrA family protein [Chloroflexi bacterium]|nr:GtrA family protein [Chloroflexota bacterium]
MTRSSDEGRLGLAEAFTLPSDFTIGGLWRWAISQTTLIRFAIVGGSGYLLYQAILFLVYDSSLFAFLPEKDKDVTIVFFEHGDARLLITTLIATALVLVAVFGGHHFWTFRDRDPVHKPLWLRFLQFAATALTASAIVTVTVNVLVVQFDFFHFIALPIGVGLAGVWDWIWYSQFVWRRRRARARSPS